MKNPENFRPLAKAALELIGSDRVIGLAELYVNNILNHQYILKGSFFTGAAIGEPRSFLFKVSVNVD